MFSACDSATKHNTVNVTHFESGFSLYQDTIFVNIKGDMTHAFKYHDKFYILFEQRVLKYGGYGKRWLYIISNGNIEKVVDFPKDLKTVYLDFYVKNDFIILKPYMGKQSYFLDLENFIWEKLEDTDDLIFEDEKYYVHSLDFGEWGGKTWFIDKNTGSEYVIEVTTPLVNKIDTTYYLTNPYKVLKIENPLQLNKCDDDITYRNIKTSKKYYSWYGDPVGFDVVYEDTAFNYFDFPYEPYIVSSFVLQNELFHIYETDSATYIAKVENNSLKLIQKIAEKISFLNWYYSYRCKNLNGKNELLKFYTGDEQVFGLMEIIDNKIFVHYFMNKAELSPKSIGAEKADSIFVNRFNLILSELGNLQLKEIDFKENKWGSFDITPNHKIGISESYYPNPNKYKLDTFKSYLVKEDSLISNSIIYYSTKANDLIRVVSINWEETEYFKHNFEMVKETFKKKSIFLEDYITQKVGKPIQNEERENFTVIAWKSSSGFSIHIEIMKKGNRLRLLIYKD